jgi:Tol biopolymer transport system component
MHRFAVAASYKLARPLASIALVTGSLFAGLWGIDAKAEPPASDGARAEKPAGRIYASIVWRPPQGEFAREIVEIDPQTGKCETIAADGSDPRLSPDGRNLAYCTSADDNKAREVWVKKLHVEEEPQRIWSGGGTAAGCWTRDGKHVLVSEGILSPEQKWKYAAWLVDPDTSEASELDIPATDEVFDCAHGSDRILTSSSANSRSQLFTMNRDGTQPTEVTSHRDTAGNARFSPDDKKIAVMGRWRGMISVCSMDADGKNLQMACTAKGPTEPKTVCWSPDSKRLAVVLFDWAVDEQGRKILRAEDNNHNRIVLMAPDGANAQELTLDRAVLEIDALDWR